MDSTTLAALLNNGALVTMAGAFLWLVRYIVTDLKKDITEIKTNVKLELALKEENNRLLVEAIGVLRSLEKTVRSGQTH